MNVPASLKVMADYDCFPLWDSSSSGPRNIDPRDLPIPPDLASALVAWSDDFSATLNRAAPQASGFPSPSIHRAFVEQGQHLTAALRAALPHIRVIYFNGLTGQNE